MKRVKKRACSPKQRPVRQEPRRFTLQLAKGRRPGFELRDHPKLDGRFVVAKIDVSGGVTTANKKVANCSADAAPMQLGDEVMAINGVTGRALLPLTTCTKGCEILFSTSVDNLDLNVYDTDTFWPRAWARQARRLESAAIHRHRQRAGKVIKANEDKDLLGTMAAVNKDPHFQTGRRNESIS